MGLDIMILYEDFEIQMVTDLKPGLHGNQDHAWLFASSEEVLYQEEKTMASVICKKENAVKNGFHVQTEF